MIAKVISGGQTGVDRAALDVALELGIPIGGWCPKGRRAEDGRIPDRYPLDETPSADYPQRTLWNVRDADHTLILSWGPPTGGTQLTLSACLRTGKPHSLYDLSRVDEVTAELVRELLAVHRVGTLNVAGPRESSHPGIYDKAAAFLGLVLRADAAYRSR